MIIYRCEIQLLPETTLLDIWKGFCVWRCKSKYSNFKERQWLADNKESIKSDSIVFELKNNQSTTIERFVNAEQNLFCIKYTQDEGEKKFTSIVIVNLEINSLSYVMEEFPYEISENAEKNYIPKPRFFYRIDSFIDKKYVPSDFRGDPVSFTPNIFVSQNIPAECFEYLKNKYEHTANIRIDNIIKQSQIELDNPELIETENDIEKKSSYYITTKRNFDFVERKLTWAYLKDKII